MNKRILIVAAISLFTGCATQQQGASGKPDNATTSNNSLGDIFNRSVQSINDSAASVGKKSNGGGSTVSGGTLGRKRLSETDLKGIFSAGSSTEWPRVAVTINKLPKWFYGMPPEGTPGRYSQRDCITISLVVWSSKKSSKNYDNISFCGDDIVHNVPFSDVGLMWKSFGLASATSNTGAKRTNGPMPPERLFPNKPGLDMFFQINGSYFVGSIMATLGYNWKEPSDYRFWIVNVPTQAEVVQ